MSALNNYGLHCKSGLPARMTLLLEQTEQLKGAFLRVSERAFGSRPCLNAAELRTLLGLVITGDCRRLGHVAHQPGSKAALNAV